MNDIKQKYQQQPKKKRKNASNKNQKMIFKNVHLFYMEEQTEKKIKKRGRFEKKI